METRKPTRNVWEDPLPEAGARREILEQARQAIQRAQSLLASLEDGQLPPPTYRQSATTQANRATGL